MYLDWALKMQKTLNRWDYTLKYCIHSPFVPPKNVCKELRNGNFKCTFFFQVKHTVEKRNCLINDFWINEMKTRKCPYCRYLHEEKNAHLWLKKQTPHPNNLCQSVFRSGRHTVRREHNSKLIVTMPAGKRPDGNTDGKQHFNPLLLFNDIKCYRLFVL